MALERPVAAQAGGGPEEGRVRQRVVGEPPHDPVARLGDLGFGHTIVSEIELPNRFANLI
jgi:hypothetical protein